MQFYEIYQQSDKTKIDEFARAQLNCQLITKAPDGRIRVGIFNHHFDGEAFFLHLNKNDEQISDLRSAENVLLVVHDFLAVIPSYWIDAQYGGAATAYYRYAEFECRAELVDSPPAVKEALQSLMDHYQPEGKYEALNPESPTYEKSFKALFIVKLIPTSSRTKWKLGQNRPLDTRKRVVERLKERGSPRDLQAAQAVEEWISVETQNATCI